ncbi:MAG TPA: hypothetical protein VFK02_07905 [Kofleriaceae bacterium]|nr:hypothetical protein [Kofleriaceae bacterium]
MTADLGGLAANKAELCNVSGSMGKTHWYKLSAALPGSMDYVELDLYDQQGPFAGGAVHTGMFPVDPSFTTCGVCVRGLGGKGTAAEKEYLATGGMVNITALGAAGAPISATLSDITLVEVNKDHTAIADGCTASVAGAKLDGTVVQVGGTGGGGGGAGGGGGGGCATTIGD